jgi:hypothetical protein
VILTNELSGSKLILVHTEVNMRIQGEKGMIESLPPDIQDFIRAQVSAGNYSTILRKQTLLPRP